MEGKEIMERAHMLDDVPRANLDDCGDVDVDQAKNRFKLVWGRSILPGMNT